jgi:hypothetical protein
VGTSAQVLTGLAGALPDTEIVQNVEIETDDPTMQGEMAITYTLTDAGTGLHQVVGLVGVRNHTSKNESRSWPETSS